MDIEKARDLEAKLKGKQIGGWTVETLIDHGKSAAVFLAHKLDQNAALKIFDDDLIVRYGDETQFERIERERHLVGKRHENLVEILDGGVDPITKNHYIIMGYLHGPNLKKCLLDVPAENISDLIAQLASAAKFLEDLGYCHRDIKPENIILLDNCKRLILLDLGVIRPLAGSTLTDIGGVQAFVGTLQYSSPEFLLREEDDSIEGWRALTFYQIGGVLHDLIMRKSLFDEFSEPYARLVNAVQLATPEIQNSSIPHRLIDLARCCLVKPWRTRLKLVDWASFERPKETSINIDSAKQRVTNRAILADANQTESVMLSGGDEKKIQTKRLVRETLDLLGRSARSLRTENTALPPISTLPRVPNDNGIALQFAKVKSFLPCELMVQFTVEIVDLDSRAIKICSCAHIGDSASCEISPLWAVIFKGTFDGVALHEALEFCVYDLIDQVQQQAQKFSECKSAWLLPSQDR